MLYEVITPNVELTDLVSESTGIELVKVITKGEKEKEILDLQKNLEELDIDGIVSGALASEYQRARIRITSYNVCYTKLLRDVILSICLIFGMIYYEIYILGIILLLIKRFNNLLNKKIVIITIPIIISLLIAIIYTDILNQNLVYKILALTGLGVILYSIYSFLNKEWEI